MAVIHYPNVLAPFGQDDHSNERTHPQRAETHSRNDEDEQISTVPHLPVVPPPTLQKYSYWPPGQHSALTPHDSANTLASDQTYPFENAGRPYQASSKSSSASNGFTMTPMSSIEMEKSSFTTKDSERRHSRRSSHHRDPEKGHGGCGGGRHHAHTHSRRDPYHHHHPAYPVDPALTATHLQYSTSFEDDEDAAAAADARHRLQEAHAGRILFFLAFPCVALSLLNAVWTLVALGATVCAQPVRLCAPRRPAFGRQLEGLVGPALNLQLRCIDAPLPPPSSSPSPSSAPGTEDGAGAEVGKGVHRPGALVTVQLLAPLVAFGIMVAAWVVAVFWLASAMIGDPGGSPGAGHHDDGRDTVLGLRGWWERWLVRSVRGEEERDDAE